MSIRAAIVLLIVLNVGVAAWWILHDAPPPATVPQPSGVPRLQLLAESAPPPADAPAARVAPSAVARPASCPGPADAAGSWRVFLPGLATPEAAQAMAARIGAAGISDYLVMREGEGDGGNAIALGLFSTLEGAQRRVEALEAAGFQVRCARIAASTPA